MKNLQKIILKNNDNIIKTIYWNKFFDKKNKDISIVNYIENNDVYLREKLTSILDNITENNLKYFDEFKIEKDFSFWLLSNFEEKNLYKKNKFYELTKVIALIEIVKNLKFNDAHVYIDDKIYKETIKNILNSKKIQKNTNFKNFKKNFLYEFISLFKAIIFLFRKLFHSRKKIFFNKEYNLFISFFSYVKEEDFKKGNYISLFWGNLKKIVNMNILNLYIKNNIDNNFSRLNHKLHNLSNKNEIYNFLDSFLDLKVIWKILIISFKIKIRFHKNLNNFKVLYNNIDISPIMLFDLGKNFLLFNIVIKLYYFYLFDIFFKKNNFNQNCFYIHENQPWEKSLIYHWKRNNKGKIFGVINSSVRFWDIRYKKTKYNPDILLANGQDSFDKLLKFGYKNSDIKKVEALRYDRDLYFEKSKLEGKNEILILYDYSKKSNEFLTNILNKSQLIKNYKIYIKKHPLSNYKIEKSNFKFHENDEGHCKKIFDLVICTNKTTASVDYYIDGQKIAILIEPNSFNFSPLKGNMHCEFFHDNIELDQILKNTSNSIKKNNINSNFFLINSELNEWKKIFNNE